MYSYNKKTFNKFSKNKYLIISIIFIFLVSLFFFMNKYYKENFSLINYYLSYPYIIVRDTYNNFKDSNKYRLENEKLKQSVTNLEALNTKNNELEKNINELKEQLELKNIYSSYSLINSTVISRNKLYWFNTFIIDKGLSSGIKKDMAVVTAKGLIGKIINVSKNTSTVKLITNNDNNGKISVAVKTTTGYSYGTISGYDKDKNLLIVTGITNYDKVSENSKVVTTGLGVFPSGITIGYVTKLEEDNFNTSRVLYVLSNDDFNDINYVTVLGNIIND